VLNLPILIELEVADAFEEEGVSTLGRETQPPGDARFLTSEVAEPSPYYRGANFFV
jgi:hypothetical protein